MRRRASLWSVRGVSWRGLLVPDCHAPYDKFQTIAGFRFLSAPRVRRVKLRMCRSFNWLGSYLDTGCFHRRQSTSERHPQISSRPDDLTRRTHPDGEDALSGSERMSDGGTSTHHGLRRN